MRKDPRLKPENQYMLEDGFSTTLTFQLKPLVKLFEKEVNPPVFDSGGSIDITTMRNTRYRTFASKSLATVGNITATVAYATVALTDVLSMIGVYQLITLTFPDDSYIQFNGYIDKFNPSQMKEGDQPTASITIVVTMRTYEGAEAALTVVDPPNSAHHHFSGL